jgi:hypothetical protein
MAAHICSAGSLSERQVTPKSLDIKMSPLALFWLTVARYCPVLSEVTEKKLLLPVKTSTQASPKLLEV